MSSDGDPETRPNMKKMINTRTPVRRRPIAIATTVAGAMLAAAAPMTGQEPSVGEKLELARDALRRHYELQAQIAREEADWRLSKEILQSRVEASSAQVGQLRADIEEQQAKTTEADEERLKLLEQLESLDALHEAQVRRVRELEHRIRRIIGLSPKVDSLTQKIQDKIDRLPDPGAEESEIKTPLSERYLNVLAILKFIGDFHRTVTVVTETRSLADGREVEVRVLYLGLGQAFFAGGTEVDPVAGFGFPTEYGWQWEERPDSAGEIRSLIDIYEGREVARFVEVPAVIK